MNLQFDLGTHTLTGFRFDPILKIMVFSLLLEDFHILFINRLSLHTRKEIYISRDSDRKSKRYIAICDLVVRCCLRIYKKKRVEDMSKLFFIH